MLPAFLIEETTVRESGESAVFDANQHYNQNLVLTFGITHAVEHESLAVEILRSEDGLKWMQKPVVSFAPKSYCGTYQLVLPRCEAQYLKARWKVVCWSRDGHRPFFRFYVFAQQAAARAVMAGAA